MHADGARRNDLSGEVIDCAFAVLNTLGAGFLEKVHENALALELLAAALQWRSNPASGWENKAVVVGEYFVDLPVADALLVAPKTAKAADESHRMQCTSDFKAAARDINLSPAGHGRACPGHPCSFGGGTDGRDKPGHDRYARASASSTVAIKATGLHLCLRLNSGRPRLEIKRVVHGL